MSDTRDINIFCTEFGISFVADEIRRLSISFREVNVYYLFPSTAQEFPSNVNFIFVDFKNYSAKRAISGNVFSFFWTVIAELINFPAHIIHLQKFRNELSGVLRSYFLFNSIKWENLKENYSNKYYTFWFNDWATVLSIAKSKNKISNYYTRTHGTDLFEDRVPVTKHIAFRKFQLKHVTKVFSVSKKGAVYLKNKYPKYASKVSYLYLGTEDHGENPINKDKGITLVSCATIRNIKRIHLIPEILKEINIPVMWYHIGGENANDPTLSLLKQNLKHLPENVKYEFKGHLSNEEVFTFYKSIPVDLFISVSETEGLPVSMMEAISFGIPILSTNVGGCNEIVTSETGQLIPAKFDTTEVSKTIIEMKKNFSSLEKRNKIREFWKVTFNAILNHQKFIREIGSN